MSEARLMGTEKKTKIRDRRKPGWFRIDDEIIEVYGSTIGVHGIAVYAAICRYAGKDETGHPSLRTLCEKLKIGRAKLLSTLAELAKIGLIEIDPGDRVNVSLYTLLDVPKKRGSNENQKVVPTRTGGGSESGVLGGSDQNRNQISTEPDTFNQSSSAEKPPPQDNVTAECLLLLSQVVGFPRDENANAAKLQEYRDAFPNADAVEVCQDFAAFISEKPFRKNDKPRLRLRNFFKTADKSPSRGPANGQSPPGEYDHPEKTEADYEWWYA